MESNVIKNIVRFLTEGVQKVERAYDKIDVKTKKYRKSQEKNAKVVKKTIEVDEKLVKKLEKLGIGYDKAKTHIKRHKSALEKNRAQLILNRYETDKAGKALRKMSVMQALSTGEWQTAFPFLNKTNKLLNSLRWSMVNVGFALGAMAGLAAPFVLLGKWAANLEMIFTRIEIVTGTFAKSAQKSITDLRRGTMFSLEEMGTSFLEFTKQGFSAADALKALPSITGLATVGFTTLDNATKIVAQTMHQFNLKGEDAAHIANVLAKAANMSAADVETFGVAMSYAGPIAGQAGVSFEETAAALAILSNMGLSASKSGTSLAAAFTQMISPSDSAEKRMKKLGITFFNTKGEMRDMDEILKDLSAILGELPEEEKLKFLTETFQTRGARAISGLLTALESGEGSIASFTDAIQEQDYVLDQMVKVHQTTTGKLKIAWNDFKESFVESSESIMGAFTTMLDVFNVAQMDKQLKEMNLALSDLGLSVKIDPIISELDPRLAKDAVDDWAFVDEMSEGTLKREVGFLRDVVGGLDLVIGGVSKLGANWVRAKELQKKSLEDIIRLQRQFILTQTVDELIDSYEKLKQRGTITTNTQIEGFGNVQQKIGEIRKDMKKLETMPMLDIRELTKEADTLRTNLEKLDHPLETAKLVVKDIQEYLKTSTIFSQEETSLTKNQLAILKMIGDEKTAELATSGELLEDYREMRKELMELDNLERRKGGNLRAGITMSRELELEIKIRQTPSEITDLNNLINNLTSIMDDFESAGFGTLSYETAISELEQMKSNTRSLFREQEELNEKTYEWNIIINDMSDQLQIENSILKENKNRLKEVNDVLKELSKPIFTQQREVEKYLKSVENYFKEQEFLARGLGDAHTFLISQLGKSREEIDLLVDEIYMVNNAVNTAEDSYKAWQETVMEFIKGAITAGQDLNKNVTDTIKTYQTLLLGTSRFSEESKEASRTDAQQQYIEDLSTAYDLYYGLMNDEVKIAIQTHEEEGKTIFETAEGVIDSLEKQWKEQQKWTDTIDATQSSIDNLSDKLTDARDTLGDYRDSLADIRKELEDIKKAQDDVARGAFGGTSGGGGGTSNNGGGNTNNVFGLPEFNVGNVEIGDDVGGGWTRTAQTGGLITTAGLVNVHPGEVIKPAEVVQPYTPSMDSSTSVSIGNISISGGADMNAEDIGRQIAIEIKNELRSR